MASAWRIVLASEAAEAFSGEGALRYGGRWNSPGGRVVYASEHQSTAALEVFIHNKPFAPDQKYKAFKLHWPDGLTESFPVKKLPLNWRISPPSPETMEIGGQWLHEGRSVVLAVPSAITPADMNFLLNPQHRDFRRIRVQSPIDFEFDSRLLDR